MARRRGSSAPYSHSSSGSEAGSNSATTLPMQQVSQPAQAPQLGFIRHSSNTNQFSSPGNPGSMAGAMNSPSLLQFGQMSAQNSPLLYGPQSGTQYDSVPAAMENNPFSAGGAIANGTAYGFNQPVPNYAGGAW